MAQRATAAAWLEAANVARLRIRANIRRIDRLVGASVALIHRYSGDETQLVVLPEYSLTGAPMTSSAAAWRRKAAFEPDGAEFEALGAVANRHQLFLAGNAYEADPNFPELYCQTSFLISPQGNVVLRYRRLISLFSPTPYDVWDLYLDLYGLEGVFPVADTPIARVGDCQADLLAATRLRLRAPPAIRATRTDSARPYSRSLNARNRAGGCGRPSTGST